eukprot:9088062-Alexandrium_andersonii.AAC.1
MFCRLRADGTGAGRECEPLGDDPRLGNHFVPLLKAARAREVAVQEPCGGRSCPGRADVCFSP